MGREQVERQTVSGWWTPLERAAENQVWNWVKGLGERDERERVERVYWSAWWVVVELAGATVLGGGWLVESGGGGGRGCGGVQINLEEDEEGG